MPTSAQLASQLLVQDRRVVAKLVLARLEDQFSQDYLAHSFNAEAWIGKIETHLQTLAACIQFQSPLLLDDYVRWGSVTPDQHPPFPNEIETCFQIFEEVARLNFANEIGKIVTEYIEQALKAGPVELPEYESESPLATLQQQYLSALLALNRHEAVCLATEAIHSGVGVVEFYLDVLQPSQREIGRLWQTGKITVAQEHYCTAATQFVMTQLQPYFLQRSSDKKTLVASCVGEELHEVGLRIISDIFEMDGWNTVYLGANAPAESVAKTLIDCKADVLAISTTMTRHLFVLANLISVVRSIPDCHEVKIIVGGYPFNIDPFLWKRMGADGSASSARDAIRIANGYLTEKKRQGNRGSMPPVTVSESSQLSTSNSQSQDELSRLNNQLITAQRELHKTNLQLKHLYELSEQKSRALEEADRRKDEFLAMLAHELRGPLAPMQHAVTILEMKNTDATIAEEAQGIIKRQIRQMAHLIGDLLDASRIAHGKIDLKTGRVNLSELLKRAIEITLPLIKEKSHEFCFEDTESSIVLEGDDIRLTQVFANLLSNAAKYTEESGTILLKTWQDGNQAVIEVKDNGIGIESDILPHIFGTFTQEQRGKSHSQGGLGIGLSLVKQLVELHQGTVVAESAGAGKGCKVTVRLPALEPTSTAYSSDEKVHDMAESCSIRRILIVDDSVGIAKVSARLFKMLGHEPLIAMNGKSAIEMFQKHAPEIVILDLTLPDMTGFDVVREIRFLDRENRTLIVAQTGNGDENNRLKAQEAGFDEYLVKPVDVAELSKLGMHPKLPS